MIPTNLSFKVDRGLALNDAEQGILLSGMLRALEELQKTVIQQGRTINELSVSRSRLDTPAQTVDSTEPVRPKSNK
jgi:hypothetical protein